MPAGTYNSVWNPSDTNYYNSASVQIGNAPGNALLTVDGKIHANELIVKVNDPVPDYVFDDTYNLRTLKEVERYISENNHLPEIPSAGEIQRDNIDIAKMNMLLLKKVEELTLYLIQNEKRIKELEN